MTSYVSNGLIAYFNPNNASSYSGSGATLNSLVGSGITGTLGGTYSYSSGTIRLTNTSTNATSNVSRLDLVSLSNVRTISMWVYIHSVSTNVARYLLDARSGASNGFILHTGAAGQVGTDWSGSTYYLNNGDIYDLNDANIFNFLSATGQWVNITVISNSAFTDDITLFGRYFNGQALDCSFGPIMIYNRAITRAEQVQNFYASEHNYLRIRSKAINTYSSNGLIAYFNPNNSASYSGSGSAMTSLAGSGVTGTLGGTYSYSNGVVRIVNNTGSQITNNSRLQVSTLNNVRSVSMWVYLHSSNDDLYRILIDGYRWGEPFNIANRSNISAYFSDTFFYVNNGNVYAMNDINRYSFFSSTGVWTYVTFISNTPYTGGLTLFTESLLQSGLDCSFGPIMVYNRVLTRAEHIQNFYATEFNYIRSLISYQHPYIALTADSSNGYVASSSGTQNSSAFQAFKAFDLQSLDYDSSAYNFWHSPNSGNNYDSSTGAYLGATKTIVSGIGDIYGEYVQIQLPQSIVLTSFTITPRRDSEYNSRSPNDFVIVGSNDGTTWTQVYSTGGMITWDSELPRNFAVSGTPSLYSYYRLITKVVGNNTGSSNRISVIITEWSLYTSTVSNINTPLYQHPFLGMTADSSVGYVASSSGSHDNNNFPAFQATNLQTTYSDAAGYRFWHSLKTYNSTTGVYTGSQTTTVSGSSVAGEWLQLQLPYRLILRSFTIAPRNDTPSDIGSRGPNDFIVAGSNDGSTWTQVYTTGGMITWVGTDTRTFTITNPNIGFSYYRLITKVVGNASTVTNPPTIVRDSVIIPEWNLFGTETALLSLTTPTSSNLPLITGGPSSNTTNTLAYGRPGFVSFSRTNSQHLYTDSGNTYVGGAQVQKSTTFNISTNGGFTAVCLVRFTGTAGSNERIFDFAAGAGNNTMFACRVGTTTSIQFTINNGDVPASEITVSSPVGAIVLNEWTLFAFRYTKATNRMEIYKNGSSLASKNDAPAFADRALSLNYIGKPNWTSDSYTNMDLVGFLVYDRSLSDAEITTCSNILYGSVATTSLPATPVYRLLAHDLMNLNASQPVSNWGQFIQATAGNRPTYSDVIQWTGLGKSILPDCQAVAFNPKPGQNRWIAGGGTGASDVNSLVYSNDGINWTGLGKSIIYNVIGAFTNGSVWIITGDTVHGPTKDSIAVSADNGLTWVGKGNSTLSTSWEAAWNPKNGTSGRWVAGGHNEPSWNKSMFYSDDNGTTWSEVPNSSGISNTVYCIQSAVLPDNSTLWVLGCANTAGNTMAWSLDGLSWTGLGTSIINDFCYDIQYNGTIWVAVGSGTTNVVATSFDGKTWTGRGKIMDRIREVCWTGTYWVASGEPGASQPSLAYSTDGITWTSVSNSTTLLQKGGAIGSRSFNLLKQTLTFNDITKTVGDAAFTPSVSTDAVPSYSSYTFSVPAGNGVATTNGSTITIVGEGSVIITATQASDGFYEAATATALLTVNNIRSNQTLTFSDFTAIFGRADFTPTISTNASPSYSSYTFTVPASNGVAQIVSNQIRLIGAGSVVITATQAANSLYNQATATATMTVVNPTVIAGGSNGTMLCSADGTSWTSLSTAMTGEIQSIGYNPSTGRWVAVGSTSNNTQTMMYSDSNGTSWTNITNSQNLFVNCYGVDFFNSVWVATGDSSVSGNSVAVSSNDGVSWTGKGSLLDVSYEAAWNPRNGTNSNSGRWVAVGHKNSTNGPSMITSDDNGTTWRTVVNSRTEVSNEVYCIRSITTSDGSATTVLWVAGGNGTGNNTLAWSSDGWSWTGVGKTILSDYCRDVQWNGSLWVAVGSGTSHIISTSSDGKTWTGRGKPAGMTVVREITWSGTYWIITGEGTNALAYSTDGINWTGVSDSSTLLTLGRSVGTKNLTKFQQTLTFNSVTKSANTTFTPTVSTDAIPSYSSYTFSVPAGNGFATTNGSTVTTITNGTTTITATQAENTTYTSTSKSTTLTVGTSFGLQSSNVPSDLAVISNDTSYTYGTASGSYAGANTVNLSTLVSSSSFQSYTFSIQNFNPSGCASISGNTLTFSQAGTVNIQVTQSAGGGSDAGGPLYFNVELKRTSQTLTFNNITKTYGDANFTPTVTTTASPSYSSYTFSVPVSNGVATTDGNTITIVGVGSVVITATQASNSYYNSATVTATLTVSKGSQTLTFNNFIVPIGTDYTPSVSTNAVPSYSNYTFSLISSTNRLFITGSKADYNSIAYSNNGFDWSGTNINISIFTRCDKIYWNGTIWVAVGIGDYSLAYSYNGIDWTGVVGSKNLINTGSDVTWNGSLWVAVGKSSGAQNSIVTSTDGITWTGRGTIFGSEGKGIAWNGSLWVAVGIDFSLGNTIATSTDGITWTGRGNTVFTNYALKVIWNGSLWVAVGGYLNAPNTLATSTDGITWTGRGTPLKTMVLDIAWNGSMFVIGGTGFGNTNSVATSTDGITWTQRGGKFLGDATTVSWTGMGWIAAGVGLNSSSNNMFYSYDGITWTGMGKFLENVYSIFWKNDNIARLINNCTQVRTVGRGSMNITATQASNSIYNSATATATMTSGTTIITGISNGGILTYTYGDVGTGISNIGGNFVIDLSQIVSSNSSGTISYSTSNAFSSFSGSVITFTSNGTASVTFNQSASADNYYEAVSMNFSITLLKKTTNLVFNDGLLSLQYNPNPLSIVDFAPYVTSNSNGQLSFSANSTYITFNGSNATLNGSGTVVVHISQAETSIYASASISSSIYIAPAVPTYTLNSSFSITYNQSVSGFMANYITSNNPNYMTETSVFVDQKLTYSSDTLTAIEGGETAITLNSYGTNFSSTSITFFVTVNKASQTITFANITATRGNSFQMYAYASGGGTNFTFTPSDPSRITNDETKTNSFSGSITSRGVGYVDITATESGNQNYSSASATARITILRGQLSMSTSSVLMQFNTSPFNLNTILSPSTLTSSGDFTNNSNFIYEEYSDPDNIISINGDTLLLSGVGNASIKVIQEQTDEFLSVDSISTLEISKADQTITFGQLPDKTVGDASFNLTATSSSGLPISYSSSNTAVATVSNATVVIVGKGTTTITASQNGNANYNSESASQSLTVKNSQTLTFNNITKTFGDAAFTPTVTTNASPSYSSYTFSVPASNGVATTDGSTITIVGVGSVVITATQASNVDYSSATATATLTVNKGNQTLSNFYSPNFSIGVGEIDPNGSNSIVNWTEDGGNTWTGISHTGINLLLYGNKIVYNGSKWIIVGKRATALGGPTMISSTDGFNWSSASSLISNECHDIAYNGTLFVAVGEGGTGIVSGNSTGTSWTSRGSGIFTQGGRGVAWNGSLWIAVGYGLNHSIATSLSGTSWTGQGKSALLVGRGIASNGSMWVAVGGDSTSSSQNVIVYSTDGTNWNVAKTGTINQTMYSVVWQNNIWLASGEDGIWYSLNGINWTQVYTNVIDKVLWSGSRWFASRFGGIYVTSTDGINWTNIFYASFIARGIANKFNTSVGQTIGLSATVSSGLTPSFSSAKSSVGTINGSNLTIAGGGFATLTASQSGNDNYNSATSINKFLTVYPGSISYTTGTTTTGYPYQNNKSLVNLADVITTDGTVTFSGSSSYSSIDQQGAGILTFSRAGESVDVSVTHYETSQTLTFAVTLNKGTATINASNITTTYALNQTIDLATLSNLSSDSTGTFSYSVLSGGSYATITTGSTLRLDGATPNGTPVQIRITQTSDDFYLENTKDITVTINKGTATINASNITTTYALNQTIDLATLSNLNSDSTGSFSYSILSGSSYATITTGSTLRLDNVTPVGSPVQVRITQSADTNYAENTKDITVTILNAQTVSFSSATNTFNETSIGATFALSGRATSATSSSNPIQYSLANNSGVAIISGSNIVIQGGGVFTLRASQPAFENYGVSNTAEQTITVYLSQNVEFSSILSFGSDLVGSTISLSGLATSSTNGTNPIQYELVDTPSNVATISNNSLEIAGSGVITLRAYQNAGGYYNATTTYNLNQWSLNGTQISSVSSDYTGTYVIRGYTYSNPPKVEYSEDKGNTWSVLNVPYVSNYDPVQYVNSNSSGNVLTVTTQNRIYISRDSGSTWSLYTPPTISYRKAITNGNGTKILVFGDTTDYLYLSVDGGISWNAIASIQNWTDICANSDFTVFAGCTEYNVYVSLNGGIDWIQTTPSNSPSNRVYRRIACNSSGSRIYVTSAVGQSNGNIYYSANYGQTWKTKGINTSWYGISCDASGTIVITGDYTSQGNLWNSSDGGDNWIVRSLNVNNANVRRFTEMHCSGNGKVFFGTSYTSAALYRAFNDSLTIIPDRREQFLNFTLPPTISYGTVTTLSASSTSGLSYFLFSSFNPNIATVVLPKSLSRNASPTLVPQGVGSVTVASYQDGDATYLPASKTVSTTIIKGTPTISGATAKTFTYGISATGYNGTTMVDLTALGITSNSDGLLSYTEYSDAENCGTVSNNILTFSKAGTITIRVNQASTSLYTDLSSLSVTFTVQLLKANPTISGATTKNFTDTTTTVDLTTVGVSSNSSGTLSYTEFADPDNIGTVSSNILTISKVGTITIQVNQTAGNFHDALSSTVTFDIVFATSLLRSRLNLWDESKTNRFRIQQGINSTTFALNQNTFNISDGRSVFDIVSLLIKVDPIHAQINSLEINQTVPTENYEESLTNRASILEDNIASQGSLVGRSLDSILSLSSRASFYEESISSQASLVSRAQDSILSLSSRASLHETNIASQASLVSRSQDSIVSLSTRAGLYEDSIASQASLISKSIDSMISLSSRASLHESSVASQGSLAIRALDSLVSLSTRFSEYETSVYSDGSKVLRVFDSLVSLSTRVSDYETSVYSEGSKVLRVFDSMTSLSTRASAHEVSIHSEGSKTLRTLDSMISLSSRASLHESSVASQGSLAIRTLDSLVSLSTRFSEYETSVYSEGSKVLRAFDSMTSLSTRAGGLEDNIHSQGSLAIRALDSLTSLSTRAGGLEDNIHSQGSLAIRALDSLTSLSTRASAHEVSIHSEGSKTLRALDSLTSLSTRASAHEVSIHSEGSKTLRALDSLLSLSMRLTGVENNINTEDTRMDDVENDLNMSKNVLYAIFDGHPFDANYSTLQLITTTINANPNIFSVEQIQSRLDYITSVIERLTDNEE